MVKHARKKQKLSKDHDEDAVFNDANKDDGERMLESILFGTKFTGKTAGGQRDKKNDTLADAGGNEFGNLLDKDLFFVDDGELPQSDEDQHAASSSSSPSGSESDSASDSDSSSSSTSKSKSKSTPKTSQRKSKTSAWADPSDPTTVSLSHKRLRKLRDAPHEEELQGREYESRLRRQFERINPVPEWASQARNKIKSKEKKKTAWADDENDEAEADAEDETDVQHLLSSSSGVLRFKKSKRVLQAGTIDIARLRDANQDAQQAACGDIKSLAFHPSPMVPVLAVGSKDRRVRLYNVDGHLSPLLQTLHIPSLPFTSQSSVQFHPGGTQLLLTGSRPFFYVYDLQSGALSCGAGGAGVRGLWGTRWDDPTTSLDSGPGRKRGRNQDNKAGSGGSGSGSMDISSFSPTGEVLAVAGRGGYVHLVDWKASATSGGGAGQVIGSLKCSAGGGPSGGGVKGLWWVPPTLLPSKEDGDARTHLAVLTGDSEVYIWDVAERRCVRKWKDEGGYRGATRVFAGSVAPAPRGGLLSIGSTSGLVNMYDPSAFTPSNEQKHPKPIKTLENLTTPISSLRFNPDGQLLAVASKEKKDALKLFHTPSLTTYANWPTSGTPLGHVTSIDFSAGSEYMAIGNSKGRVLLFSLKDYAV
ncbi:U3 snoRNP protein [Paramarasmius palmivorus]|uniref:U3 snoRNP protein n=1 Tax=Paramarasmius palmivorus TaxID=297713 RepID=A0AAW0DZM4_9AGAR